MGAVITARRAKDRYEQILCSAQVYTGTVVLSRSGCVHALVLYGFNRFIKQLPQLPSVVVRVEMILQ